MACPRCSHANDEQFRFCQQCGYTRGGAYVSEIVPQAKKVKIDEENIAQRLDQLSQQRGSSCYVKQKSALEQEFSIFLHNLATPKFLASALPADVIAFLVWKDRGGKTQVHLLECPNYSHQRVGQGVCQCPKRLAFGTVDSLIGKLRAIFVEHGRGFEWQSVLNIGNPASDWSVKRYLADVREEQLKARVVPCQAEPFLLEDLMKISSHIHFQLMHSANLTPSQIYILARDQAMFKVLFFAGDRAADLLGLKMVDILSFPDNSGLLLNHPWTKSLRSGDVHVFALKRGTNTCVCPVRGIKSRCQ